MGRLDGASRCRPIKNREVACTLLFQLAIACPRLKSHSEKLDDNVLTYAMHILYKADPKFLRYKVGD